MDMLQVAVLVVIIVILIVVGQSLREIRERVSGPKPSSTKKRP